MIFYLQLKRRWLSWIGYYIRALKNIVTENVSLMKSMFHSYLEGCFPKGVFNLTSKAHQKAHFNLLKIIAFAWHISLNFVCEKQWPLTSGLLSVDLSHKI